MKANSKYEVLFCPDSLGCSDNPDSEWLSLSENNNTIEIKQRKDLSASDSPPTIATKQKGDLIKPPFVYSLMIVTGHKTHKRNTPQTPSQKESQNSPINFLSRCKAHAKHIKNATFCHVFYQEWRKRNISVHSFR